MPIAKKKTGTKRPVAKAAPAKKTTRTTKAAPAKAKRTPKELTPAQRRAARKAAAAAKAAPAKKTTRKAAPVASAKAKRTSSKSAPAAATSNGNLFLKKQIETTGAIKVTPAAYVVDGKVIPRTSVIAVVGPVIHHVVAINLGAIADVTEVKGVVCYVLADGSKVVAFDPTAIFVGVSGSSKKSKAPVEDDEEDGEDEESEDDEDLDVEDDEEEEEDDEGEDDDEEDGDEEEDDEDSEEDDDFDI